MRNLLYGLLLALLVLSISGCEQDPMNPEGTELQLEEAVQKMVPYGWNANRLVKSGDEIAEVTNISRYLEDGEVEGLPGLKPLRKRALQMTQHAKSHSYIAKGLYKPTADSLLFYEDNPVKGIRKALFYDAVTGKARYYEVKYKFLPFQNLVYDSSSAIVDIKYTLDDTLDDQLLNLYQLQEFKESFFVQKIINEVKVTDMHGKEITGVEATKNAWYRSTHHLSHLRQLIDLEPDKSGHLREDFAFKDKTTFHRSVTFRADNTGEFEKKLRDGTLVYGSFNSLEDDGYGTWQETTDFPAGRFIDKIEKSAKIKLTFPDSVITVNLVESIHFGSGKVNTDSARIVAREEFDVKYTTIDYYKYNGEEGHLEVEESAGGTTLNGNWTTVEKYYLVITAEYYLDESGHINLKAYESETAFQNGEAPFLVADYYFSPDGSGNGTLTHKGQTYDVTFDAEGEAMISANGEMTKINLFE